MQMPPTPLLVYALALIASRFAFRHRERVAVTEDGFRDRSGGPGPWRGAVLCLLPLAVMQLGPFIEFVLRAGEMLRPFIADPRAFPPTTTTGLLIFAAGTALAAFAARQLRMAWSQEADRLCTTGVYAVLRHPMYAGYLIQGVGCALMLSALWSWGLYGLAVLLIFVRIVVEDRELAEAFPEAFPAYRERVKRLVPFVF